MKGLGPILKLSLKCVHSYSFNLKYHVRSPLSALLAMQVISSSYHSVDPPPAKTASPCRSSTCPPFLRRFSKSFKQSSIQIADEKAIPVFLNPDLEEPQSKGAGICALPSIAASSICTHNESTFSMASLPPTPTWIATPPTPPYKNMRKCNASSKRRSCLILFTPSTSCPAAASPATRIGHANTSLKRCTSVPSISSRVPAILKPLPSGVDERFVHTPKNYEIFGPESKPAKLFLSSVPVTDNEDGGGGPYRKDIPCLPEITSPEGGDHSVDDFTCQWGTLEKNRDSLRKFHALKELLATEVGYLKDLKALVTVTIFKFSTNELSVECFCLKGLSS